MEIILNEDLRIKAIDFSLDAQEESMGFETALATYELEIEDTLNITEDFNNNSGHANASLEFGHLTFTIVNGIFLVHM